MRFRINRTERALSSEAISMSILLASAKLIATAPAGTFSSTNTRMSFTRRRPEVIGFMGKLGIVLILWPEVLGADETLRRSAERMGYRIVS